MAGRAFIASALLLLSCRRAPVVELVKKDPTPPVDAAPVEKPVSTLALLHGRIVDVRDGRVLHVLREKKPLAEVMDAREAVTLDADGKLRVWDVAGGILRSEQHAGFRRSLLLDRNAIVATDSPGLRIFDRASPGGCSTSSGVASDEFRIVSGHVIQRSGAQIEFHAPGSCTGHATRTLTAPVEGVVGDHTHGLAVRDDSVCYALFEPPNHRVECLDLAAKPLRSALVSLGRPTDVPGTRFLPRFISRNHIVIGTWSFGGFKSTRRAAVVRLSDGNVTVVEEEVAAAVERPDGTLEGLLVTEPELKLVSPTGALRWMEKRPRTDGFAAVALIDDRLVIALYNAIATGVDVFAVRVTDGKPLWTGETKLPPIGHSKYRNLVTLETLGDAVILRGDESSVKHVHVYDSKTGALRFSDAQ